MNMWSKNHAFWDVKKYFLIAAMVVSAAVCAGCSESTSSKDNDESESDSTQQISSMNSSTDSSSVLDQSQPDSKMFSVLPQDSEAALNIAAKYADKKYPVEKDSSRSYGYVGTQKIKGKDCFCFKVYNYKDEEFNQVAEVAVNVADKKVFVKQGDGEYKAAE